MYFTCRNRCVINIYNDKSVTKCYNDRPGTIAIGLTTTLKNIDHEQNKETDRQNGYHTYKRYSSRTIVVDFRHRFTVVDMNDTPVPIGQIHSFHSYTYNGSLLQPSGSYIRHFAETNTTKYNLFLSCGGLTA